MSWGCGAAKAGSSRGHEASLARRDALARCERGGDRDWNRVQRRARWRKRPPCVADQPDRRRVAEGGGRARVRPFYLENGRSRTTYDNLVGPKKHVKQVVHVESEDCRQIVFEQGRAMTVTM